MQKGIQNALSIMVSNLNQYDLRFNSMKAKTAQDLVLLNDN